VADEEERPVDIALNGTEAEMNTSALQDPIFWCVMAAMLAPVAVGLVLSTIDMIREWRGK
jgi:hypothetical protein